MEELEKIIKDYEEKLFKIFKRNIDAKVIECKAYNYDPIKTYIEIRKVIIELEEEIKMYSGLSQVNDELGERVIDYTEEYMNDAIEEFKQRANQLLKLYELDELIEEVDKLKEIIRELKSVGSESISEGVVFQENQNYAIMNMKKRGC
jgi:hypothetical protein